MNDDGKNAQEPQIVKEEHIANKIVGVNQLLSFPTSKINNVGVWQNGIRFWAFSLPRKSKHVFQKWVLCPIRISSHTLPTPCNN